MKINYSLTEFLVVNNFNLIKFKGHFPPKDNYFIYNAKESLYKNIF